MSNSQGYAKFKKNHPNWDKGFRYAGIAAKTAAKALSVAYSIAQVINVEKKHYDCVPAITAVTTTPTFLNTTAMGQGTTDTSRIGNSVLSKSIQLRGYFAFNSAGATQQHIRCLLIRDSENTDSGTPTIGEILENVGGGWEQKFTSPLNMKNSRRFRVLKDKVFTVDQYHAFKDIKIYYKFPILKDKQGRKIKGIHSTYGGAAPTDTCAGSIYWIFFSDQATNAPTHGVMTRYRFIDN